MSIPAKYGFMLLLLPLFLCGCYPLLKVTCHKTYSANAQHSPVAGLSVPRTTGMFVGGSGAYFFYEDGRVFFTREPAHICTPPLVPNKSNRSGLQRYDSWGDYYMSNDTLIIQRFHYHPQEACTRSVIEEHGFMMNDTTFRLVSKHYHALQGKYPAEQVFDYWPCPSRLDQTKAWLVHKGWYLKNLHPSRR